MQKPLSPKSPLRSQEYSPTYLSLGDIPLDPLPVQIVCSLHLPQGSWPGDRCPVIVFCPLLCNICVLSFMPSPSSIYSLVWGRRRAHLPLSFSKDDSFPQTSLKHLKPREKLEFYNQHTYFKYFTTYTLYLFLSLFSLSLSQSNSIPVNYLRLISRPHNFPLKYFTMCLR